MSITWTRAVLRAKFREYTGRKTASQISDSNIDDLLNDYYVNLFPSDAKVDEFDTFFTQELSATDDGVYDIGQNVDRLDDPVTINGSQIQFYRDRERFFSDYPDNTYYRNFQSITTLNNSYYRKYEDEQYITNPNLAIGTVDATKVKYSDFDYSINNYSYSVLSSEIDLTGGEVPRDTYGAWSFKVDKDGLVTVTAADGNSTGYLTPRLAIEALESADSESAYMGYVTVTRVGKGFIPGGSDLDTTGINRVTTTFTDGRFEGRTTPISALLYGQKLYVWPKPNDIYQLKSLQIADRPDELASDSDTVDDPKWGNAVAIGTANVFLLSKGETETVRDLAPLTNYLFDSISQDKIKRYLGGTVYREF